MENELRSLQIGDKVVLEKKYISIISTVSCVTKEHVFVDGCKFRKCNGLMVEKGVRKKRLKYRIRAGAEALKEFEDDYIRYYLSTYLQRFKYDSLTTEHLGRIVKLVTEEENESPIELIRQALRLGDKDSEGIEDFYPKLTNLINKEKKE